MKMQQQVLMKTAVLVLCAASAAHAAVTLDVRVNASAVAGSLQSSLMPSRFGGVTMDVCALKAG